jgi:hypothetical protein
MVDQDCFRRPHRHSPSCWCGGLPRTEFAVIVSIQREWLQNWLPGKSECFPRPLENKLT